MMRKWKDYMRMDRKGGESDDVKWIHLTRYKIQCRFLVNMPMNVWIR